MIKQIFLPEKIGHRRILSEHIIGLGVHDDAITLAYVYASSSKAIVERLLIQPIEEGSEDTRVARSAQAIKKIMSHIKKYDQLRVSIPASLVLFKELEVPFLDKEKIRMILDYEIESMLPFSLNEAIIDFIITKQNKAQGTSQILVAVIRNHDLQSVLDIYTQAGLEPDTISIDLFSLYGLYLQIPEYRNIPHASALIDLESHTTRIAFLKDGELRLTRYIPRGLASVFRAISEETGMPIDQVTQKLSTQSIGSLPDDAFGKSVQKHVINFLNDIQFTLNSFSLKLNYYDGVGKIIFVGQTNIIKDFIPYCNDTLQISCEAFDCKKIFENKKIKNKVKDFINHWSLYSEALGTALPPEEHATFNLRRKSFELLQHGLIIKQLITACSIALILVGSVAISGYVQISRLQAHAKRIETTEITKLKKSGIFPRDKFPKKPTLANVVREAEKQVKDNIEMWEPFAQTHVGMLEILAELTRIINKKQYNTTIISVDIKNAKEAGNMLIEVDGYFKSKTGEDNFIYFEELATRFKESPLFKLLDSAPTPAEEKGVKFSIRLTLRETEK